MKKLFAFFFLVFFSMFSNASSHCDCIPQCDGPGDGTLPCDSYWVCWCSEVRNCPTADGGWILQSEPSYYW